MVNFGMKRSFRTLSPMEILALAISAEEEDGRIYQEMAKAVLPRNPDLSRAIEKIRKEEDGHRRALTTLFSKLHGESIPLIRREDVSGFLDHRRDFTRVGGMSDQAIAERIALYELEAQRFYETAAQTTSHVEARQLFSDLAEVERNHESQAHHVLGGAIPEVEEGRTRRQLFILQIIQPSLVGLMDGSVSTLAPIFAAAYATQNSHSTFLIGVAAAVGSAISMGFAEGLSDDGSLTGRGKPLLRGVVTGLMTFLGGILHTLPFLMSDVQSAIGISVGVVVVELLVIAWIRNRFMETPMIRSILQVIVGGALVFLSGLLIGHG